MENDKIYQRLFIWMAESHDLSLTQTEMDDIIEICQEPFILNQIESVEGATAYLESKGIDVKEYIKRGLRDIDIISLASNKNQKT